jgi:hypothetical protein
MDEVIVLHKLLGDGSLTSSGGSHDNAVQVSPRSHSPTKVPHTYNSCRNHPVLTGWSNFKSKFLLLVLFALYTIIFIVIIFYAICIKIIITNYAMQRSPSIKVHWNSITGCICRSNKAIDSVEHVRIPSYCYSESNRYCTVGR